MKQLSKLIKSFRDDESGLMSVEFVLVTPILVWVFISGVVYFDVFGVETNTVRSTITLAEIFSREDTVNSNFIDNAQEILRELTYEEVNPDYRITVFTFFDFDPTLTTDDVYRVVWSRNRGWGADLTNADLVALDGAGRLPIMAEADHNVLIETRVDYDAPFNIGIGPFTPVDLDNLTFTNDILIRPRSGRLCFDPTPSADGDEICDPP